MCPAIELVDGNASYQVGLVEKMENIPSNHKSLIQCRFNVGTPSVTLAKHQNVNSHGINVLCLLGILIIIQ